ncbi:sugar ABC transporter permease [Cohnella sp. WQ 127256]|uniref:ABC transporter permease n=1 Tax=Cohnella sp. WQ 127256 TaxID=2938790 RepID=UPI00211904EB|nr:ABC transporter permease subunit [Cohnella sp. WQ 127256]
METVKDVIRIGKPLSRGNLRKNLKHWQLMLFILIPLIYLLIFKYYPMLGAQIAFKDFKPQLGIWGSEWVGMKHFDAFFQSYQFERVLRNTFVISLYSLIAGFPIPIILALLLHSMRGKRFKSLVETVSYMPHFISTVVIVGMIMQLFNPHIGLAGVVSQSVFGQPLPDLFGSPGSFSHLYVWSGIWQNAGWGTIIYAAALAGVDPAQHEAAQIDGASRFKRILYVDLPAIMPTITILLIINAGNMMSVGFEKVFLMQTDLNLRSSEIISTYVYKVSFVQGSNFSFASAIGLFNSLINMVLLLIVNGVTRRMGGSSLW